MANIISPPITVTVGTVVTKKLVGKKISDPVPTYTASPSGVYANPANPPLSGFSYVPATQIISFTASAVGSSTFTLSATNALGVAYKIDQTVNVIPVDTFDTLEIVDVP